MSIGLATRVVDDADLATSAGDLAKGLASGPALAYGATKVLIGRELDMDLDRQSSWRRSPRHC